MRNTSEELQQRARQLRRQMTPAERRLWNALRSGRIGKFRRQHAIGQLILDFYCPALRLCVEVDGGIHDEAEHQERDRARTHALSALGIRVVRFRNEEILSDTPGVLRRIRVELAGPALPESPLPRAGEGGEP